MKGQEMKGVGESATGGKAKDMLDRTQKSSVR
ncbi:hypothetical protein J2X15_002045 [Rhodoferax saidenbachensis]|uniref:CsbD family protein n=1 Tax=Rhodoferax saidenbachensis TaxID=1484693 RepID=A0ABU1ZMJ7_9BURK|nr:hypothetical protein [Rhodoferax saidenbachensis]